MYEQPFIIERIFNAPLEKVWKALTDKEKMKLWYFDFAEFKSKVGLEFQFLAGLKRKNAFMCAK